MKPDQIEAWALSVIDRVKKGQHVEDSRVELKSEWPADASRAARRIAGHANSAAREPILWLIGVDEEKGIVGAKQNEFSNWLAQIRSEFDEMFPRMTDIVTHAEGKSVVALLIETDRAPFVVKNPKHNKPEGGPVSHEVPWREGTAVRTARRSDLVRILSPLSRLPGIEILGGELSLTAHRENFLWHLILNLYVSPVSEDRVVIPFHKVEGQYEVTDCTGPYSLDEIKMVEPKPTLRGHGSLSISSTETEVFIDGPGRVNLYADTFTPPIPNGCFENNALVEIDLVPVNADSTLTVQTEMKFSEPASPDDLALARWRPG